MADANIVVLDLNNLVVKGIVERNFVVNVQGVVVKITDQIKENV